MGVATGVASPMKMEMELSPEFAVQMLPLASIAMPAGELKLPNPAAGEMPVEPENSESEVLFANHALPLPS